jgi:hypothetical protein
VGAVTFAHGSLGGEARMVGLASIYPQQSA